MSDSAQRRGALAWALYDCGNSAFATTVMAGFFPIFFKQYWSAFSDVKESTLQLGVANSIASVVVAVLAPILGALPGNDQPIAVSIQGDGKIIVRDIEKPGRDAGQ